MFRVNKPDSCNLCFLHFYHHGVTQEDGFLCGETSHRNLCGFSAIETWVNLCLFFFFLVIGTKCDLHKWRADPNLHLLYLVELVWHLGHRPRILYLMLFLEQSCGHSQVKLI